MIKFYVTPPAAFMTIITGCFGVILFIKSWFMIIFMTFDTFFTDLSKTPFITFFMTGETGCG